MGSIIPTDISTFWETGACSVRVHVFPLFLGASKFKGSAGKGRDRSRVDQSQKKQLVIPGYDVCIM